MKIFSVFSVAVIITIVATVTVINGATDSGIDADYMEEIPTTIHSRCPPNVTSDFDVIFNGEDSSTAKGCASVEFRARENGLAVFHVTFGRLNNGVCVSGEYADMKKMLFFCLSKSSPKKIEYDSGKVYMLDGIVVEPEEKHQTRCILFKTTNSVMNMMVISGTTSCKGLSMTFDTPATLPKGSMLLRLNKLRDNPRHRRSTSEDKNSTQLNTGPLTDVTGFWWTLG